MPCTVDTPGQQQVSVSLRFYTAETISRVMRLRLQAHLPLKSAIASLGIAVGMRFAPIQMRVCCGSATCKKNKDYQTIEFACVGVEQESAIATVRLNGRVH